MSEPGIPEGLDVAEARSLIKLLRDEKELRARVDTASAHFLGRPYIAGSLVGSPDSAEVFTARLDGFDCVTYIETVLAFALSGSLKSLPTCFVGFAMKLGRLTGSGAIII